MTLMDSVVLRQYPMPPPLSQCFGDNPRAKSGRSKTNTYRVFDRDVLSWSWKNAHQLNLAREITTRLGPGLALQVELVFTFPRDRILLKHDQKPSKAPKWKNPTPAPLRKKGQPKRLDVDNRLKAFQDTFVELLGVDDSELWCVIARKKPHDLPIPSEWVDIRMQIVPVESADEWLVDA